MDHRTGQRPTAGPLQPRPLVNDRRTRALQEAKDIQRSAPAGQQLLQQLLVTRRTAEEIAHPNRLETPGTHAVLTDSRTKKIFVTFFRWFVYNWAAIIFWTS